MKTLLLACLWMALMPAYAGNIPLSDFSRNDSFDEAQISPDGHYAGMTLPYGRLRGIAVIDIATKKPVAKIAIANDRTVADYLWVNNKRLVVSIGEDFGGGEAPSRTGELMAFDYDGSRQEYLFGYHGVQAGVAEIGTRLTVGKARNASAFPIRALPNDPGHMLVMVYNWADNSDYDAGTIYRMDVDNGHLDHGLAAPMPGPVKVVADDSGFVRYAVGQDGHQYLRAFVRTPEKPDWAPFLATGATDKVGARAEPLFVSRDGKRLFLESDERSSHDCLLEQNLESGASRTLACDAQSDLVEVIPSFDGDEPIGARFASGRNEVRLLDSPNPSRAKLAKLLAAFPGQTVRPVSLTRNGSRAIVLVDSDRNPGDYYLFETAGLKADYLVGRSAWLDPDAMPPRQPISFEARDGQLIQGYLTIPQGKTAKQLPLVLLPHGGPFWVADRWQFDPEAAAIASRGYAVLQVNFRGSGGYGQDFVNAGKRGWATTMIDDLTDGTRWAIAQGIADPARIGVYGASYGGYAALTSAEREPALYRCVATYAGVFDLPSWQRDTDFTARHAGRNYVNDFVGADPKRLLEASPSAHLDQLRVPVLIVHGEQDQRVPLSQAEALRKSLDERKLPYEWLIKSGEGHGFYNPANRAEFLSRLLGFLDRNLAPVTPTPAASGAP